MLRALTIALLVLAPTLARAEVGNYTLGNPNASVHVIEYGALGCPFCRQFEREVWPDLYSRYIATGRVSFELREAMVDEGGVLGEEGYIVARCAAANGRYFDVVQRLMTTQVAANDPNGTGWLIDGGAAGGLSAEQVNACLSDRSNWALFDQMQQSNMAEFNAYSAKYNIQMGFPSVFVNGRLVRNALQPGAVTGAIDAAAGQ